jgi:hypothetical protein
MFLVAILIFFIEIKFSKQCILFSIFCNIYEIE